MNRPVQIQHVVLITYIFFQGEKNKNKNKKGIKVYYIPIYASCFMDNRGQVTGRKRISAVSPGLVVRFSTYNSNPYYFRNNILLASISCYQKLLLLIDYGKSQPMILVQGATQSHIPESKRRTRANSTFKAENPLSAKFSFSKDVENYKLVRKWDPKTRYEGFCWQHYLAKTFFSHATSIHL